MGGRGAGLNAMRQQDSPANSFKLLVVISICGRFFQIKHLHEQCLVEGFNSFEAIGYLIEKEAD